MSTHVFYTPHTDDECIGMAGLMVRAMKRGHDVRCVLVTDNKPSTRGERMLGGEGIDLIAERRNEWGRALQKLGPVRIEFWEVNEAALLIEPFAAQQRIQALMHGMHYQCGVDTRHHTVQGAEDVHAYGYVGSLAHVVCAGAARRLALDTDAQVVLHGVYVYSRNANNRLARVRSLLSPTEFMCKQEALGQYRKTTATLGYGYMSVPELIDNASSDPHEYLELINVSTVE